MVVVPQPGRILVVAVVVRVGGAGPEYLQRSAVGPGTGVAAVEVEGRPRGIGIVAACRNQFTVHGEAKGMPVLNAIVDRQVEGGTFPGDDHGPQVRL
ncbi:hypothetical protein [Arthrobacter nitrophenolicus]|uniref:Uncharacterized protein n=1 Tax=Arthrobacter nitrophenolicus TaxID=683150 RepID=L8TSX2_9MICC|nr:hypothetical protein [Arthrobacter nitrophenolicus]ELT44349.1 hypothetical protein G205_12625 [Arthrobacter nitrophenolicus]